jgi:hypothetical protein
MQITSMIRQASTPKYRPGRRSIVGQAPSKSRGTEFYSARDAMTWAATFGKPRMSLPVIDGNVAGVALID